MKKIERKTKIARSLPERTLPLDAYIKEKIVDKPLSKSIYLHSLNGFSFEKLIEDIFRLHEYEVQNIQYVGDQGRDLIVEKDNRRILIECKFQRGTIGRPVVQKLHSAVVVDVKADQGIVITTGKFSKQALEYVRDNKVPIVLWDLTNFRKFALDVNIRLLEENEIMEVGVYNFVKGDNIHKNIIESIDVAIISKPHSMKELLKLENHKINFIPTYRIEYDIDHITQSPTWIVYELKEKSQTHLKSSNLHPLSEIMTNYFKSELIKKIDIEDISDYTDELIYYHEYKKVIQELIKILINKHSKNVSYKGLNNVTYNKYCEITPRDISILNVARVFVPIHNIIIRAIDTTYEYELMKTPNKQAIFTAIDDKMIVCNICDIPIEVSQKILCNSCGQLSHYPFTNKRKSHGFFCDECGKTICRDCGYWKNKWMFMKKVYCEECAKIAIQKGEKIEKIPQIEKKPKSLRDHVDARMRARTRHLYLLRSI